MIALQDGMQLFYGAGEITCDFGCVEQEHAFINISWHRKSNAPRLLIPLANPVASAPGGLI
jgi:hypothetical protein